MASIKQTDETRKHRPLQRVIISRYQHAWKVSREREENGESAICSNLEECFEFVRALYDVYGKEKNEVPEEESGEKPRGEIPSSD